MKRLEEYINEGMFDTATADILNIDDEMQKYWDLLATLITFPRAGGNDERLIFWHNFNQIFKREIKKGRNISTFDPKKDLLIGIQSGDHQESRPDYEIVMFQKGESDEYMDFSFFQKRRGWRIESRNNTYKVKDGWMDRFKQNNQWGKVYFPVDIKSLGWKWEKLWKNGLQNIKY